MEYRTLGRTGLRVGEIGMGTYRTFDVSGRAAAAHCAQIAAEALGRGLNFFDTAPMYGEAEDVLGRALEARRGEALIATKVLERDAASARASIERSLKLLRTDTIDLLQIHNMAGWRRVTPVMQEFQREGRVRFIGITDYRPSNFPEMMEAMRTGLYDTVQIPYHLGERECRRALLPLAREMDLGVIVMTPIQPIFSRSSLTAALSRADLAFLAPYGVRTPGQALLKCLLSDPAVSTLIPATGKVERVAENAAVSDGKPLPPEAMERLERLI
ncbi:MAG: aldo/keto reductase [bacterium]